MIIVNIKDNTITQEGTEERIRFVFKKRHVLTVSYPKDEDFLMYTTVGAKETMDGRNPVNLFAMALHNLMFDSYPEMVLETHDDIRAAFPWYNRHFIKRIYGVLPHVAAKLES